ncbi:uncharacterized protein LOC126681689 [Mercurialis annua]|uniref:uncharacterized protein LOC126681689 n=1 Tax=Mercurialis annua TaxID=3986 RepID=UPI00215F1DB9|nr:uncharacterized protein LOC126681689 [Mercurialis annua]
MSRSPEYNVNEDIQLCQRYMEISQDSATGVQQSSPSFWRRVQEAYNGAKDDSWEYRNERSVSARIRTIEKAIRKLNGSMRQIEMLKPSGASNEDIMSQAKILPTQDPLYRKGFKFDHVWNMMKDFEKFKNNTRNSANFVSSESKNPMPDSPKESSPGLSNFSMNLNDDGDVGIAERPTRGLKKSKLKRKKDEEVSRVINSIKEDNKHLMEMMKNNQSGRDKQMEYKSKNLAFREFKEENKILTMDLNSIVDPYLRAFWEAERRRIVHKRAQHHQSSSGSKNFNDYFTNIGGSDTDLQDY